MHFSSPPQLPSTFHPPSLEKETYILSPKKALFGEAHHLNNLELSDENFGTRYVPLILHVTLKMEKPWDRRKGGKSGEPLTSMTTSPVLVIPLNFKGQNRTLCDSPLFPPLKFFLLLLLLFTRNAFFSSPKNFFLLSLLFSLFLLDSQRGSFRQKFFIYF